MAKRGRRVTFHGAFGSKVAAKAKERQVGGFVQPRTIRGQRRWLVMSENVLRSQRRKRLSIPEQHQLRIARKTLRMPDPMVGVMGGPSKAEALRIVRLATRKNPHSASPSPLANIPRRPVKIYDGVVAIVARKGRTKNPKLSGKLFEHKFNTRPKMYGLPDGSLLVTHRRL